MNSTTTVVSLSTGQEGTKRGVRLTPGQLDDEPKGHGGADGRMVQLLCFLGRMQLNRRGVNRVPKDTYHPDEDPQAVEQLRLSKAKVGKRPWGRSRDRRTSSVPDTFEYFLASSQILQLPSASLARWHRATHLGQKVRTKRATAGPDGSSGIRRPLPRHPATYQQQPRLEVSSYTRVSWTHRADAPQLRRAGRRTARRGALPSATARGISCPAFSPCPITQRKRTPSTHCHQLRAKQHQYPTHLAYHERPEQLA